MAPAVLIRGGGRLCVVDTDRTRARPLFPLDDRPEPAPGTPPASKALQEAIAGLSAPESLHVAGPGLVEWLARLGVVAEPASLEDLRRAREALPSRPFALERTMLLVEAHERLAQVLASPEQTLIALAREEERMERVLAREQGAADQWIAGDVGALREHAEEWVTFRSSVERHHDRLVARVEGAAHAVAPNLSTIVGPRVAARLIAAAGGIGALARMSASRLQLLGSRRRPGGRRGPKYGVIASAVVSADIPPGREGAYARSLSALAAIAARADSSTRAPIAGTLLGRRDARLRRLRQEGRR